MPLETLWECICRLAGEGGEAKVRIAEAVDASAVPEKVAVVELRLMVNDGLITTDDQELQLTERGRKACSEVQRSPTEDGVFAPES